MSLTVETGTGSANSEAYATVAYADTYHAAMGNTSWAALSEPIKEQNLRKAATFMCQVYRLEWKGSRVNSVQALDWPRYDVELPDLGVANVIMPDVVPILVQQANVELALIAVSGPLNPNAKQAVSSKQVGPIKISYEPGSKSGTQYTAVDDMLSPLLGTSSNGVNFKLRRM